MKKLLILISLLISLSFNLFAAHSLYQELKVSPENLESTLSSLMPGLDYSIIFEDDFDFSKVDQEYFKTGMIEQIHYLFDNDSDIKFSGCFEYIYFDGTQTPEVFYDIREQLNDGKNKYFCVDISASHYSKDFNYLPDNCFANHENLYWVYFGSFLDESISNGVCKNCKNLESIFLWDFKNIGKDTFRGCKKDCKVVDEKGYSQDLSTFVKKNSVKNKAKPAWDYLNFETDSEINYLSDENIDNSVEWMIDGDYLENPEEQTGTENLQNPDDISDEQAMDIILNIVNEYIQDIKWSEFGEYIFVNKENAKSLDKKNPKTKMDTIKAFLAASILKSENYTKLRSPNTNNNDFEDSVYPDYNLNTFPDSINFYIFQEELDNNTNMVGFEYYDGDKIIKDMLAIQVEEIENKFYISYVFDGLLTTFVLQSIFGEQ